MKCPTRYLHAQLAVWVCSTQRSKFLTILSISFIESNGYINCSFRSSIICEGEATVHPRSKVHLNGLRFVLCSFYKQICLSKEKWITCISYAIYYCLFFSLFCLHNVSTADLPASFILRLREHLTLLPFWWLPFRHILLCIICCGDGLRLGSRCQNYGGKVETLIHTHHIFHF